MGIQRRHRRWEELATVSVNSWQGQYSGGDDPLFWIGGTAL